MSGEKQLISQLFAQAGITINGPNPWDITVHNEKFYSRLLSEAELAMGETYVDGWWDCPSIDQLIFKILDADLEEKALANPRFWHSVLKLKLFNWMQRLFNFQTRKNAYDVGKRHYDVGNDVFRAMLDKRMIYTCGYWYGAHNLDEAQLMKLELVCRKMDLKPGMKILDIGCGWGGLIKYAVENYGVSAVGITVSQDQVDHAQQTCKSLPVEIRFQDYRDLEKSQERYDRIISLGMFEHVGYKNYREYMLIAKKLLKEDGLFLLHTIGRNHLAEAVSTWIHTYIFPTGQIPTIHQIAEAFEELFVMENWENFGSYYDNTLMAWHHNFNANWDHLRDNYSERFRRMWNYYLLSCAGSFRSRHNQLWQIVLSNKGILGGFIHPLLSNSPADFQLLINSD